MFFTQASNLSECLDKLTASLWVTNLWSYSTIPFIEIKLRKWPIFSASALCFTKLLRSLRISSCLGLVLFIPWRATNNASAEDMPACMAFNPAAFHFSFIRLSCALEVMRQSMGILVICHSRESGNPTIDSSPRKRGLKHSGMTTCPRLLTGYRLREILLLFWGNLYNLILKRGWF